MIETFAHRLAQKLISLSTKNTVTKDDIAVVSYGIECLLNLCIPFFFFLIYSCFTHRILGMVYFLISFLFLVKVKLTSHLKSLILTGVVFSVISIPLFFISARFTVWVEYPSELGIDLVTSRSVVLVL